MSNGDPEDIDGMVVYLNGLPVTVPRHTLTGYETREALGALNTLIGFEGAEMPVSFADGWDFIPGQRFVTLGSMSICDPAIDQNADTKDMPLPWEGDPDAWKGDSR